MPAFVDVAVPLGVRRTFSYAVPPRFQEMVTPGVRVLVPFGPRILTGFVVGVHREPPAGNFKLRAIREVVDARPLVPSSLLKTALWVAENYFTSPGEVLRSTLPAGTQITGSQRVRLSPQTQDLLDGGLRPGGLSRQQELVLDTLARDGPMTSKQLAKACGLRKVDRWIQSLAVNRLVRVEEAMERPRVTTKECLGMRALIAEGEALAKLTPKQRQLYNQLDPKREAAPLQRILRQTQSSLAVCRALERKGLVKIEPMPLTRLPLELSEVSDFLDHTLTEAQQKAFHELMTALQAEAPSRYLLHGVTGSGKTEIYLRLIGEALKLHHTAILMVPEIGLTPLLSRIALSHFPDQVAVLHSGMSLGERFDQWNRIRCGEAQVVVGTRSAVFAPLENPKLIVVDEEQDPSYKQDESPYYHAREVAWNRILQSRGVLLMGSATPSIETFHAARETGEIAYLNLPERIQARPMADVQVVDMSVEFQRHGKKIVVSETLRQELDERLRRGEQSIIMLNRRGYSRSLLCRSCGHVFMCPDCSVSMTYHQGRARLVCHYCGIEREPPSICSNCNGEYIYYVGVGTEQLEEMLRRMFPKSRLARVDRDTTRRRGSLRAILLSFARGDLDILLGTQILAKGHDFPNVTLVGVIAADADLSFPDFRSAERTFQLLTQVAGRAGRGEVPGKVVIQSFYPDHYAVRYAKRQDYAGFFGHEKEFRKLMTYPPFTRLIQILVTEQKPERAARLGEKLGSMIRKHAQNFDSGGRLRVLGPAVAPFEKLRGFYRYQLLIKAPKDCDPIPVLRSAFEELGASRVSLRNVQVDVDPLSLL